MLAYVTIAGLFSLLYCVPIYPFCFDGHEVVFILGLLGIALISIFLCMCFGGCLCVLQLDVNLGVGLLGHGVCVSLTLVDTANSLLWWLC